MGLIPIVVIACHFAERNRLCTTTIERLEAARQFYQQCALRLAGDYQYLFVVTGDVPYEPGSPTLCTLMRDYLIAQGISPDDILTATDGTGSFAEPTLVIGLLHERYPGLERLAVVSSNWQLWAGRPFWRRAAESAGLSLRFISLSGTGGWQTRCIYAGYALLIRIALASGLWPWLEQILSARVYEPRRRGFRINGCA